MGGSTPAKLKTKHPMSQVVHSVHTSYQLTCYLVKSVNDLSQFSEFLILQVSNQHPCYFYKRVPLEKQLNSQYRGARLAFFSGITESV